MFTISDPDGFLPASDVKAVAEEIITVLPLPGVEESPLDPGDIWLVPTRTRFGILATIPTEHRVTTPF